MAGGRFSGVTLGRKADRKRMLELPGFLRLERSSRVIFPDSLMFR